MDSDFDPDIGARGAARDARARAGLDAQDASLERAAEDLWLDVNAPAAARQRAAPPPAPGGHRARRRRRDEAEEARDDDGEDLDVSRLHDDGPDLPDDGAADDAAVGAPPAPGRGHRGGAARGWGPGQHTVERRYVSAPDLARAREELGPADKPDKCFACTRGRKNSAAVTYESWKRFESLFFAQFADAHPVDLCKALHTFYEKEIRSKTFDPKTRKPDEMSLPEWAAGTIYDHFFTTSHRVNFGTGRHVRLRQIAAVADSQYANRLWVEEIDEDGNRQVVVDHNGWKLYREMVLTEARLFAGNPRTSMFSTGNVGMSNDEAKGVIMGSARRFVTANAGRLAGTSLSSRTGQAGVGGTVQASAAMGVI
jgi:hypothetical protein